MGRPYAAPVLHSFTRTMGVFSVLRKALCSQFQGEVFNLPNKVAYLELFLHRNPGVAANEETLTQWNNVQRI